MADGSPPFVAGVLPGSHDLHLNLPRPIHSPAISFTITPLPPKPLPLPIRPLPEPAHPRRNTYCPFSGSVPCTTRLPTTVSCGLHDRTHCRRGHPGRGHSGMRLCAQHAVCMSDASDESGVAFNASTTVCVRMPKR
jgi:hypothetical protein